MNSARIYARFGALAALCGSIRDLSFARELHLETGCAPADVASLDAPLAAAEASALTLLDEAPELLDKHRDTILASLHRPLIERLSPAAPGAARIPAGTWRLLLWWKTPADIALMASRGLGLRPHVSTVFDSLETQVRPLERARALAEAIGAHIGPHEQARSPEGNILWFSEDVKDIRTPLFAPWMRAQVQTFPDDAIDAVGIAVSDEDLATLLRFHLAGLPDEIFHLTPPPSDGPIATFYGLLSSNHGRMALLERSGGLEAFLKDPSPAIAALQS